MPTTRIARIAWLETYKALMARDALAKYYVCDEAEARFFLKGMIVSEYNARLASDTHEGAVDCHV